MLGSGLAQFEETVEFRRHNYNVLKVGTEGPSFKIVKRVEPPMDDDSEISAWVSTFRCRLGSKRDCVGVYLQCVPAWCVYKSILVKCSLLL